MDVRAMERGDERVVGNSVDRGRVGVDDDDRGMLVQAQVGKDLVLSEHEPTMTMVMAIALY